MRVEFIFLKPVIKNISETKILNNYTSLDPLYYDGFLNDLVIYIEKNGPTINYYKSCIYTNRKEETLGDIWLNKEVNIYCCCSGINSLIDIKGKEKDIKLKEKLNTILLIPEVYEDFYKMPESIVNEFFKELKKEIIIIKSKPNNNTTTVLESIDDLKIKQLPYLKYIMTYLIHTAQKDEELAKESYNRIKKIKLQQNIVKHVEYSNTIEVYNLVFSTVSLFYKYYRISYRLKPSQKNAIKNRTRLIHINNMHTTRAHNRLLGAASVKAQKYFKFITNIKYIDKIENTNIIHDINVTHTSENNISIETSMLLSIKDHYHVQFVDNEWHTVTMIHLPYYVYKQKTGTTINYQFHTIKDIIVYLKKTFNIGNNKKNCKTGNVYPFKYSKQDRTWSLITEKTHFNKTVQIIENENCNVVFYYIKEDIYETEFCFAQFVYSSEVKNNVKDENMNKTRIPLFLPKIMISGAVLGPYDKNGINCDAAVIRNEYKNLMPINYTEIYRYSNSKAYSSESPMYNQKVLLGLMWHMQESDLNYAIKHYYSDFFIRHSTEFYEDPQCYCMNIQQKTNSKTYSITWCTKFYESVYEYTTYKFDSTIKDERTKWSVVNQPAHVSFIDMLQRKNPSVNTALYGHCFYKSRADIDYKISPIFCLTMKDLLKRLNSYLMDQNAKDEIIDPISKKKIYKKDYDPRFILKDISRAIKNSKLHEIKKSNEGTISIRDNNYNGCKYGIHYDILSALINTHRITSKSRIIQLNFYKEKMLNITKGAIY
ncbi:hypothetical protein NEIG_00848 [Nematocida sp. ERTm5]|nr:hypothetical protein NEIG_00848 [Nematocida sp. ERTm5]